MQDYSKYKGAVGAKKILGLFWPPPRINLGSYCSENLATLSEKKVTDSSDFDRILTPFQPVPPDF